VNISYCLPIIKNTAAEVLETIRRNDADYSYFEVWLDYINEVDESFMKELVELAGGKLILLFRRQNLEDIHMPLQQRLAMLDSLTGTVATVDLDITVQTAELDYLMEHDSGIRTIVSYHNYRETPDTVRLEEIIGTMDRYRPGVYKLSAMCGSYEDALRLLDQLLKLKAKERAAIVLGMGAFGQVTRVFGTLWGNEMTFAPLDKSEQSAPGQLTKRQLENIFKELRS